MPELPPGFAMKPLSRLARKKPNELFGRLEASRVRSFDATSGVPFALRTPGPPVLLLFAVQYAVPTLPPPPQLPADVVVVQLVVGLVAFGVGSAYGGFGVPFVEKLMNTSVHQSPGQPPSRMMPEGRKEPSGPNSGAPSKNTSPVSPSQRATASRSTTAGSVTIRVLVEPTGSVMSVPAQVWTMSWRLIGSATLTR